MRKNRRKVNDHVCSKKLLTKTKKQNYTTAMSNKKKISKSSNQASPMYFRL